jgi:hypothetical protein
MPDPDKPPRRFLPEPLRKLSLAAAVLAVCEIGARIVAPGLNGEALQTFLQGGASTWLLRLYDWIGGGALSRGSVFAIGVMPYVSARIIMRLARIASPNLESWWHTEPGIARRTRVTRWLTGGLALVQSFGFAQFVQNVPGVVEQPGIGFLVKTMALLTASSIGVMLLSEALLKSPDDDEVPIHDEPPAPQEKLGGQPVEAASIDAAPAAALLTSGGVLDTPHFTQTREPVEARPVSDDDR